jgi:signal transduction histidine kinase
MRSIIESSATTERPTTRMNGKLHETTANGSRLGAELFHKQENESSSQQTAQQRERLVSLGTSAVIFAHELGNPLQSIFGCVELIESELKQKQIVDPFLMSMIEAAMREIDRLRGLLSEFRSLAKPQTLNLKPVDLQALIQEVLALQRLGYWDGGIDVKLECENPLPRVMLDATKMTQAILNLCINAVEAMPNGGCLTIRVYSSGSMVVLEIADNGIGVARDIDVFQLFKTTKPRGSGLGLAIVQQIVASHKGAISYSSVPGSGTTFVVRLPAQNSN